MYEGFREDFLRANANKEFIGTQFTEVIRHLMRAIGSTSYPDQAVSRAAEQMKYVLDLWERAEERITFRDLFARAANDLGEIETRGEWRENIVDAAQIGVSLIAELTSKDNAAGARVSKREAEFLAAVRNVAEADPRMRWR